MLTARLMITPTTFNVPPHPNTIKQSSTRGTLITINDSKHDKLLYLKIKFPQFFLSDIAILPRFFLELDIKLSMPFIFRLVDFHGRQKVNWKVSLHSCKSLVAQWRIGCTISMQSHRLVITVDIQSYDFERFSSLSNGGIWCVRFEYSGDLDVEV